MNSEMELTILMPCLNEAETLAICIKKARAFLEKQKISGEVLIADNGSTDNSVSIAKKEGARVVHISTKGYGSALLGGIKAAQGKYIVMGDSDDSYDFSSLEPFIEKLRAGYHLIMGNRFKGGIKSGAMPPLHKYLGNPVLTFIGRLFFKAPVKDFHCGLRGFDRAAILGLNLTTPGMEFASEMVVKATLANLKITEVPTILWPDGRSHPPHLRSWRDGWRHLRFLLVYSPRWLFLYPGLFLILLGFLGMLWLIPGPRYVGSLGLDIHTLLYSSALMMLGTQMCVFSVFTKVYGVNAGFLPKDHRTAQFLKAFTLEKGLLLGIGFVLFGLSCSIYAIFIWGSTHFGSLDPLSIMRIVIPGVTLLVMGVELILASFFLSILLL